MSEQNVVESFSAADRGNQDFGSEDFGNRDFGNQEFGSPAFWRGRIRRLRRRSATWPGTISKAAGGDGASAKVSDRGWRVCRLGTVAEGSDAPAPAVLAVCDGRREPGTGGFAAPAQQPRRTEQSSRRWAAAARPGVRRQVASAGRRSSATASGVRARDAMRIPAMISAPMAAATAARMASRKTRERLQQRPELRQWRWWRRFQTQGQAGRTQGSQLCRSHGSQLPRGKR